MLFVIEKIANKKSSLIPDKIKFISVTIKNATFFRVSSNYIFMVNIQ